MLITVAICSRNRAEQLRNTLASAAAMNVPRDLDWELLMVDNGSTDSTPDVVEEFFGRLPVRHILEPKAGLSNARNRGVSEARGQYICWTDDDVLIAPHWLTAYAQAFRSGPNSVFFGGPVEPKLQGNTPDWFAENRQSLGPLLAERDLGPNPMSLAIDGDRLPYGANYAVRTSVQKAHLYDPGLGVAPHQKRLGEEVAVLSAISREGGHGTWVPDARVYHIVPQSRQTLEYVGLYDRSAGETWAYLDKKNVPNFMGPSLPAGRRALGVPYWMWRQAFTHRLLFTLYRNKKPSSRWLEHWRRYCYLKGAIAFWTNSTIKVTSCNCQPPM